MRLKRNVGNRKKMEKRKKKGRYQQNFDFIRIVNPQYSQDVQLPDDANETLIQVISPSHKFQGTNSGFLRFHDLFSCMKFITKQIPICDHRQERGNLLENLTLNPETGGDIFFEDDKKNVKKTEETIFKKLKRRFSISVPVFKPIKNSAEGTVGKHWEKTSSCPNIMDIDSVKSLPEALANMPIIPFWTTSLDFMRDFDSSSISSLPSSTLILRINSNGSKKEESEENFTVVAHYLHDTAPPDDFTKKESIVDTTNSEDYMTMLFRKPHISEPIYV